MVNSSNKVVGHGSRTRPEKTTTWTNKIFHRPHAATRFDLVTKTKNKKSTKIHQSSVLCPC